MIPVSPIRLFRLPIEINSWLVFAVSLTFYWITADPGVSYWDCPEYVAVASKMDVGHPPGNPVWMLAMRVATIPFPDHLHAYIINLCSGIFMAFAVFFLCRILTVAIIMFLWGPFRKNKVYSVNTWIFSASVIAAGASLCFAFCDSVWYSAVEAEVYAMSTFLASLFLWILTLWGFEKSRSRASRLMVLLAYITGISLGVHQLNLLLLPVLALTAYFKFHPYRSSVSAMVCWLILGLALIGVILLGLIPGLLFGASRFELFAVNETGLPYHSGIAIFLCIILCLFLIIQYFSTRPGMGNIGRIISISLWNCAFIVIGFSSFGMIMIRANASPLMNEGSPTDIFSLTSYVMREQYPSSPLIYGATPYSKPLFVEEYEGDKSLYRRYVLEKGHPKFQKYIKSGELHHRSGMVSEQDSAFNNKVINTGEGYLLTDYDFRQKLTPELNIWFPRISSRNISDRTAYEDWAGMTTETMKRLRISETIDSAGKLQSKSDNSGKRLKAKSYRPTYLQNLRFFVAYQAYYMYFRYLFWNFIGRQNDFPSKGEIEHGNFITGFSVIDKHIVGSIDKLPDEIGKNNKGRNRYFGIPFIFGIIGIIGLAAGSWRARRFLALTGLLFVMTGLAIVVYLNQSPGEPRERDYTFLMSYMAFAMWIAAGMAFPVKLYLIMRNKSKHKVKWREVVVSSLAIIPAVGIPTLMALENFDDHDRRGRFEPTFFASSLLDFEIPAIIFSHGDNSSFPLWYSNEVLGMGTSHLPVDVTYLSLPSYVENLKKQPGNKFPTISTVPEIIYGKYVLTRIPEGNPELSLPLNKALRILFDSKEENPVFPVSHVTIPYTPGDSVKINLWTLTKGSSYLSFKNLMLLDAIAAIMEGKNDRILFFPNLIDHSFYSAFDIALRESAFGKIYYPHLPDSAALNLLQRGADRELKKIATIPHYKLSKDYTTLTYYADPLLQDMTRRYRGELVITAFNLLKSGDTIRSKKIADSILEYLPYHTLLPGDFTVADSTFFEGREFYKLLRILNESSPETPYAEEEDRLRLLMETRHEIWLEYYKSLTPAQRSTLSPRSRRLLLSPFDS